MALPDELPQSPIEESFEILGEEIESSRSEFLPARDRRSGRRVAIQRLRREASHDPNSVARFRSDALRARELVHPAILRVLDVAIDTDSPYCVVEWPEYGTLAHRLEDGPLSEREAYRIARTIAEALEFAHEQGIVHGRVRPSNIVFFEDGSVRLAGFGGSEIGALPGPTVRPDPYEIGEELVEKKAFDPSPDVFAFGGVLYHMSTGEPPFSVALGLVPVGFRDVIKGCIALKRNERFKSIRDVLAALRQAHPAGDITIDESLVHAATTATKRPPRKDDASGGLDLSDDLSAPAISSSKSGGKTEPPSSSRAKSKSGASGGSGGSTAGAGGGRTINFPFRAADELYEIVGEPMMGGMGSVHKAIERATGRYVAIKRIHAQNQLDPAVIQRFHREALSIAKLSHPHILQLLQPARDDEGDYLVLEWAAGGSLMDRLKSKGRLTVDETRAVARKIGSALAYAHGKGVIHRDIKPHNILLTEGGEPKLADFGLVRAVGEHTASSTRGAAGTLLYMAPEQWTDAHAADARSDIFSLGKTLYHLVTGAKPVTIDPGKVPQELRTIVMRCVEEEPRRRYSKVDDLLAELEPTTVVQGSSRFTRVLMVALALLLGAIGAAWWKRDFLIEKFGPKTETRNRDDGTESGGGEAVDVNAVLDVFTRDADERRSRLEAFGARLATLDATVSGFTDLSSDAERARVERIRQASQDARDAIEDARKRVDRAKRSEHFAEIDPALASIDETLIAAERSAETSVDLFRVRRSADAAVAGSTGIVERAAGAIPAATLAGLSGRVTTNAAKLAELIASFADHGRDDLARYEAVIAEAKAIDSDLVGALVDALDDDESFEGALVDRRLELLGALGVESASLDSRRADQKAREEASADLVAATESALAELVSRLGKLESHEPTSEAVRLAVSEARAEVGGAKSEVARRQVRDANASASRARERIAAARRALESELIVELESDSLGIDQRVAAARLAVLTEIAPDHPRLRSLARRVSFVASTPAGCVALVSRRGVTGFAKRIRHEKTGIEFVLIEPGEFTPLGSSTARIRITRPFYIARTETTVAQYRRFVEARPNDLFVKDDDYPLQDPWGGSGGEYGDDVPVVNVRHVQAERFCRWAGDGLRLPTEAEWEFAARAGAGEFWWGGDATDLIGRENVFGPATKRDHPGILYPAFAFDDGATYLARVGSYGRFGSNANLLVDVIGNVAEWCADLYIPTPYPAESRLDDPRIDSIEGGESDAHVVRGGSWKSNPAETRCGARSAARAIDSNDWIGFRVVLDPLRKD